MITGVWSRGRSLSAAVIVGGALLSIWFSSPALAQVPRIQGQGTSASGQGNAFAAQADDPSALHYNPAGMTQLHGVQIMGGGLLTGGTTSFTSTSGANATGTRDGSLAWPAPAHLYITANLGSLGAERLNGLTVGIGLTSPLGDEHLLRFTIGDTRDASAGQYEDTIEVTMYSRR